MSTFKGFFKEIAGISVDHFEQDNLKKSKLFFVSHCHADHLHGISKNMQTFPGPIYSSEVSAIFLKKQYPNLTNLIRTLEIDCPTELNYDEKHKIVVTALSAQHCPGSVMFIFESEFHKVLYTGDFRISEETIKSNRFLSDLKFDNLYLDSTFLNSLYEYFPSQIESINKICELTQEWILNRPDRKIILEVPAQYGYEYLFMELNRKLGVKIFNEEKQLQKYYYFPSMDDCISNDITKSSVLVRQKNYSSRFIKIEKAEFEDIYKGKFQFRIIKPTAIFWKNLKKNDIFSTVNNEVFRVCYSNHCSLEELQIFLKLIQTEEVTLNVEPQSLSERMKMKKLVNETLGVTSINKEYLRNKYMDTTPQGDNYKFDNIFKLNDRHKILHYSTRKTNNNEVLPKKRKI